MFPQVLLVLALVAQIVLGKRGQDTNGIDANRFRSAQGHPDDATAYSRPGSKPASDVIQRYIRSHPDKVHEVIERLIELLPSDEQRVELRQEGNDALAAPDPNTRSPMCIACKFVLRLVRLILRANDDDWSLIADQFFDSCLLIVEIDNPARNGSDLCQLVYIQGPHVAAILIDLTANIPGIGNGPFDPQPLCEFVNLCYEPPDPRDVLMRPHDLPLTSGRIVASVVGKRASDRALKLERLKKEKENAIVIAQLTDIHMDPQYAENSKDEECGQFVCCLAKYGNGTAGHYGAYRCNVPIRTVKLFLDKVNEIHPDYAIFSGDIPPHTWWSETYDSQLDCTRTLTAAMVEAFDKDIIVLPTIGNHETYPTNMFSVFKNAYSGPMVTEFARMWAPLSNFSNDQISTMNDAGYYTMLSKHMKLRFVSINSNYLYIHNYFNILNHREQERPPLPRKGEAVRMKEAVESILASARSNQEQVIMINHHPPGNDDYIISESRWYEQLMIEYKDIVKLQVAGHTHSDEFKLLKNASNDVESILFVSQSIDTHGWRNPSMRLYYLDNDTYELLDYEQHYFDLSEANENGAETPEIVPLFSAVEKYDLEDMSPKSWEGLLKRFETNQTLLLLHRWLANAAVGQPGGSCNAECTRKYICRNLHANYDHQVVCAAGVNPPGRSTLLPRPTFPTRPPGPTLPSLTISTRATPSTSTRDPSSQKSSSVRPRKLAVLALVVISAIFFQPNARSQF